jgi:hypothetical protein
MIFEDLKSSLGDWLGKDYTQLNDTIRGQLINMAQRELLRNADLRFGEYIYSFNTVASQAAYDVPTGYSRTYSIWYMGGGEKIDLVFLTKEEFDKKYEDNLVTGLPANYTLWQNKLYMGPLPDAIYSMSWNVRRLLADLVDGSPNNSNDMAIWAWEVLLFKAISDATKYLFEDARAQMWEAKAAKLENDLVSEHSREKSVHRRPVTNEPG